MPAVALVGLALSAVGTGITAYSSYQQGKSAQALNNYNATLSEQNALVAQRDASNAANAQRAQGKKIQARQRAAFAANGVVGDTGSPLLVQAQTAADIELGALETQRVGNIEASNQSQQAILDRMAGKSARRAGNINATATILQGAGNAASGFARYKGIS